MDQKRQDTDVPNRQSKMEKAEGSRDSVLSDTESFERGAGRGSERAREEDGMAGGITNRGRDREREEQRHVPERGSTRPEK